MNFNAGVGAQQHWRAKHQPFPELSLRRAMHSTAVRASGSSAIRRSFWWQLHRPPAGSCSQGLLPVLVSTRFAMGCREGWCGISYIMLKPKLCCGSAAWWW